MHPFSAATERAVYAGLEQARHHALAAKNAPLSSKALPAASALCTWRQAQAGPLKRLSSPVLPLSCPLQCRALSRRKSPGSDNRQMGHQARRLTVPSGSVRPVPGSTTLASRCGWMRPTVDTRLPTGSAPEEEDLGFRLRFSGVRFIAEAHWVCAGGKGGWLPLVGSWLTAPSCWLGRECRALAAQPRASRQPVLADSGRLATPVDARHARRSCGRG